MKPALTAPPHPICEPMFDSRGTPAANRAWATRNVTRRRTTDPAIGRWDLIALAPCRST
jgi:hypothetical protein